MKALSEKKKEDDCCMTASVNNNGVYVVGQKLADAKQQPKPNVMKLSDAIKLVSEYKKK